MKSKPCHTAASRTELGEWEELGGSLRFEKPLMVAIEAAVC